MRLKSTLALIILFFSFYTSFTQTKFPPAFIVKSNSDTIYGVGDVSKNQRYCMFKKMGAKDYTKYSPGEISAIKIIDGKYYVSKQIEEPNGKTKWYFLEFLVDGEIDLFAIYSAERYFIKKEGKELLELDDDDKSIKRVDGKDYMVQDKKYLGYLRAYMSEVPELYPKINKMDVLDQRELIKLSVNYHEAVCDEYECINYAKNIPNVTYKLEFVSGVTYHNNYYSPQGGVLVHIWRPLRNEKLYLKTGILYADKMYGIKQIESEREYRIRIPFSFQYVFGKGNFKPTVAIGWPTGLLVSSLQGGFIYSLNDTFEVSLNGSIDGLMLQSFGQTEGEYNNPFPHSFNFGLIYNFN